MKDACCEEQTPIWDTTCDTYTVRYRTQIQTSSNTGYENKETRLQDMDGLAA
eukprot:m.92297 g.92297  ORF g.92297 m.92297 type:complete len:52 (-) comp12985_c2_seq1:1397-1552(-)